jgi:hypothetical protein
MHLTRNSERAMRHALCPLPYAPCAMRHALCAMPSAPSAMRLTLELFQRFEVLQPKYF